MVGSVKLVVYEGNVSSIVEAGLEKTEDTIFTHDYPDTVEQVLKTHMVRELVIVSKSRRQVLEDIATKCGVGFRYKNAATKWYEPYISRHLIEPRIREFERERMKNEYVYVLLKEFRTLRIAQKVLEGATPRKYGPFHFIYTRARVPTADLALAFYVKKREHVCVASERDTGMAFTCVSSPQAVASLLARLRRDTRVLKLLNENVITGFIPTFPESPYSYVNEFAGILSETEAGESINLSSVTVEDLPYAKLILSGVTYPEFGKLKTRLYSHLIPKVRNGGKEYVVLHRHVASPLYTVKSRDGVTIFRVHLPLPAGVAVSTTTRNPEIVVGAKLVKPRKSEESGVGYIHYLSDGVRDWINRQLETRRTVLIAVFEKR